MIIWLNGGFGAGKTTLAEELHRRLPDALVYDPEQLGLMLWKWVRPNGDFQHLPSWRELVVATALSLRRHHADTLIVPMTLIRDAYRAEILGGLADAGEEVLHVFLEVDADVLRTRVKTRAPVSSDPEVNQSAREFGLSHVEEAVAAADRQPAGTLMLRSDRLTPAELADKVLARADLRRTHGDGECYVRPHGHNMGMTLTTRLLTPETWDDFAALVEANNGIWGGCWCMGFHPEGVGAGHTAEGNREAKRQHVASGTVHQMLVYDGDHCVGWCQFGPPRELPNIKNRRTYELGDDDPPDWRIGCVFTNTADRGKGVAAAAVGAALDEIKRAGGGVVEAYPEQTEERPPQRGAYLHTGPEELYSRYGFTRVRKIAKWRWVMRTRV